jgi:hypothetical protein
MYYPHAAVTVKYPAVTVKYPAVTVKYPAVTETAWTLGCFRPVAYLSDEVI